MSIDKKIEASVLKVYDTWLYSYLNGDVKTYDAYLDDDYHFIGSTSNEEFLTRKDTTQFFASTAEQLAGKCDLRNETQTLEQFGELIFITHVFDAWFLNETDYSYYGRFRFSNVLREDKEGWRFIYQHFSTPDSKTEDGETIGFDKINEENQELREAIKRRTFELEQKNRELKVEGALERIRAQAVAMKQSSDLLDIVVTMRNEFIKLGHEAHYFWHMMWLPDKYEKAMTSGDGTRIGFVMELPRHIHGDIPLLAKWERSNKPTVVYAMDAEEAIDYVDKMVALGDFKNIDPQAPTHDDIRHIKGLTFIMARTSHGEIGYSLPGVVENPPTEDIDILIKFAGAFDLAHQRFLDLQKAEKQAREVQIELALEKVRSRTMAMQHSDELQETSFLLDQQVKALGIKTWGCAFNIYGEKESTEWFGNEAGILHTYTVPREGIFKDYYQKGQKGETLLIKEFSGKECVKHYEYMSTLPVIGDVLKILKETNKGFPTYQIDHVVYFKYGYLLFITREPVPDAHDIFKRFAKVFEQTYTRFLDLQKAEAQAREAKIEASLEKVRSVALSLQKADDMLGIARVLYEQLLELGFSDIRNAIIDIHNDEEETFLDYDYSHDMSCAITKFSFYGDSVIEQQIEKTQSANDAFFEIELKGKDLEKLIETRLRNGEKDDPRLRKTDHLTYNLYSFGNGAIGISNFGVLNDEQKKVLKRFRNVFTFAYKRYTDLAKAEAQAREAQIEAALEKVRSRSLAMQSGDELQEVVLILVEKLKELGVILDANGITLCTYFQGSKDVLHWIASPDFSFVGKYLLPYFDHPIFRDAWQSKEKGDVYFSKAYSIEEKNSFFEHAFEHSDYKKLPEKFKQWIFQNDQHTLSFAWQKNSAILIPSNTGVLPTETEKAVLIRFSKVFEQAYIRFLDLKVKQEQSAELLAEKKRLEKTLSNLQETQKQLIQSEKMASLGELTAGIAHEIQNPLNFVNNFSEVSNELLEEMKEELAKGNLEEVKHIANDVKQNLEKINHHGKRADTIVKGMLQHSRTRTAEKEPTDINKLADEYLRLAYHGLRAKDKNFNANLETNFDENIGLVQVIPQDMGRVILNLITNAFYACAERGRSVCNERRNSAKEKDYQPTVSISTSSLEGGKGGVTISIKDNGNGIPKQVVDKIFQPFFTTKPTGKGTGLGLSMSYDIVKAHGGKITVETEEGKGTTFSVLLPATKKHKNL